KCKLDVAHVKWSIGGACFDGFTTALPPSSQVLLGVPPTDYDLDTIDENNGGPTYAAITSQLPPRRCQRAVGRWQRPFRQEHDRPVDLACSGDHWQGRGPFGGLVLIPTDRTREHRRCRSHD